MIKTTKLLSSLLLSSTLACTVFAQTLPVYVPSNNLVAWYPFSGNAQDGSTHAYHGTVNGAQITADRNGLPGHAYSFNGISDYISLPLVTELNNQTYFTLSFWVQRDAQQSGAVFTQWSNNKLVGLLVYGLTLLPPAPSVVPFWAA